MTSVAWNTIRRSKRISSVNIWIIIGVIVVNVLSSSAVDLKETFNDNRQDEFSRSLAGYEITNPVRVHESGTHLSHLVSHRRHPPETRHRRSPTDSGNDVIHYKLIVEGTELHLELFPNDRLFSPGLVVERRRQNREPVETGSREAWHGDARAERIAHNRCHFAGKVRGRPESTVALATCDGLHGYIHTGQRDYFIEPVKNYNRSSSIGHPHLIYRRSALPPHLIHSDPPGDSRASRTKEQQDSCGVTGEQASTGEQRVAGERLPRSEREGRRRRRRKRSISLERHVETLVVVDRSMMEYHRNDNIENYVLTIMNMVSTMYHDASIGNAVNIVLVRIIYLEQDEKELVIQTHADQTLASFCKWQYNINQKDDADPNHHDVAILLTRLDICARSNDPCSTLGLSQVSGLCQPHRSCNINEDTGLALAFTVAHELGHNFGMQHDTAENGCNPRGSAELQYIMAPQLTAEASPLVWSNCSRKEITAFFDRDWGHCLDDEPKDHQFEFPVLPPGVMYDIDHQCRLQYGPEAAYCEGIDDRCTAVWCRVDNKCLTRLEAAAEGTLCNDQEWCFGGKCVAIGEKPLAIDSHWGEWGSWAECTRTCGAGVSESERLCNNPPPSHGGRYCVGERKRFRICNTEPCPEGPSFREQQCSNFNHIPYKGHKYEWEPIFPKDSCQLHCKPKGRSISVLLKDVVTDGTPCRNHGRNMCINGRCRVIGCDWGIESDAVEDGCGICHGDGSTCKKVTASFDKKSGLGYVEAVVIPEGARNIRVEEVAEANNYLAIRNDKGDYYLNGHWFIQWSGDYELAGTVVNYQRDGNKESIFTPGPIAEPLHVMLLFQSQNPGIRLEYTLLNSNVTERRRPEFHWKYSDWTHCITSCGGGSQTSQVVCVEKEAGPVDDRFCNASTRPDDMHKECNVHQCPAKWWSGPWQRCSVSCGENGIRRRTVLCIRPHGPGEQTALEDWECDGLQKPPHVTHCEEKEPCPVEESPWKIGPWTRTSCETDPCSVQTRSVECFSDLGDCDPSNKPPVERPCPHSVCSQWVAGEWSQCSTRCGRGHKTRKVTCRSALTKEEVSDEFCSSQNKPTVNETCKRDCITWTVTAWLPCSASCGEGIQERLVSCALPGQCDPDQKPSSKMICNARPCFRWTTGPWQECSQSCGNGVQLREVTCIDAATQQPSTGCDEATKPSTVINCTLGECPSSAPVAAANNQAAPCSNNFLNDGMCIILQSQGRCSYNYVQRKCCKTCQRPTSVSDPKGES